MKKRKPKMPPIVLCHWIDACNITNQDLTLAQALEQGQLTKRVTIGLLLKSDAEITLLSGDYDEPDQPNKAEGAEYGNLTVIPTAWVKSITLLGPRGGKRHQPIKPGTVLPNATKTEEVLHRKPRTVRQLSEQASDLKGATTTEEEL